MKTAADMIREIADALGNNCTQADAERVWHAIRSANSYEWDDRNGYSLPETLDLLKIADEVLSNTNA